MSYSLDLNILLFAIDENSSLHQKAKSFLEEKLSHREDCFLLWEVVYGFVRIATHSGIFRNPLDPKIAILNANSLIEHPNVRMISSNQESWAVFDRLSSEMPLRGKLVPDAIVASVCEVYAVKRLYTHDRDFRKFKYLKTIDPFES